MVSTDMTSQPIVSDNFSESQIVIAGQSGNLKGRLLQPKNGPARAAVIINNATGVPARYYLHFGRWLASQQAVAALVWDYRDFGESGNPRRSSATLANWGVDDATTARRWLKAQFPHLPLWLIGHSLGGLALPFQSELEGIDRVITVAAGPVHLSDHPWRHRLIVGSIWYGHGPLLTKAFGHFPGRRLGLGSDIPGPAFWQWRRWCSRRGSVMVDPHMPPFLGDNLRAPVKLVAFSDDGLVPPPAVWRLGDLMPNAQISRCLIRPHEHGLNKIGHVAFFSPRSRAVWPVVIDES